MTDVRMPGLMAGVRQETWKRFLADVRHRNWHAMMLGDVTAWQWFMRAIEDGQARNIIAENSRLPPPLPESVH